MFYTYANIITDLPAPPYPLLLPEQHLLFVELLPAFCVCQEHRGLILDGTSILFDIAIELLPVNFDTTIY